MITEFADAAFDLQKDGDFSNPVLTEIGWHIIQRISKTEIAPFETAQYELKNKIARDGRSNVAQIKNIEDSKKQFGYSVNKKNADALIGAMIKSLDNGKVTLPAKDYNAELFRIGNDDYKQSDYLEFAKSTLKPSKQNEEMALAIKLNLTNYQNLKIQEYREVHLAEINVDYKNLMQEYHDGIILYEIMQDQVWNKAVKDTAGLRVFFMDNRAKYSWSERLDATVYECKDEHIAVQVYGMLISSDTINSKDVLEFINKESELNLKVRMNKFEVQQAPYLQNQRFTTGLNPVYSYEGKWYVVSVAALLPPAPKEFNEAKGIATSDYQAFLEKKWLETLRLKHQIVINEDVLYQTGQ